MTSSKLLLEFARRLAASAVIVLLLAMGALAQSASDKLTQTPAPTAAAATAIAPEPLTSPANGAKAAPTTIGKSPVSNPSAALDPNVGSDWVRVEYDAQKKPLGMQTAVVRYSGQATGTDGQKRDVLVDLIGAVHVGDVAYYDALNKKFAQYDALLYELVAPPGTVVERGRGTSNAHPVGLLQNGMKTILELDHQLEKIDYTRPNFVHADMSPDQFAKAMRDRNESFLQMYFRLLGTALAQQGSLSGGGPSDLDVIAALFAKDRPRRLKILMAKQLADMESLMVSFGGEQGSAIISDRNKIALAVLKDQLAAGKKLIGIFYGAGHLQDMDQRLRKDFELKPVAITWVTAWNLAEQR
jgi:hypothetical protein